MLNKYIAIGNLTGDPQIQEFQSGKKKCSFAIAVNLGKETTFIDVETWDRVAENCEKMLVKGTQVFIDGKLKYNSWKTKQGYTRNKIICSADFVKSMSKIDLAKANATKNTAVNATVNATVNVTANEIDLICENQIDEDLEKDLEEIPF